VALTLRWLGVNFPDFQFKQRLLKSSVPLTFDITSWLYFRLTHTLGHSLNWDMSSIELFKYLTFQFYKVVKFQVYLSHNFKIFMRNTPNISTSISNFYMPPK